MIGNAPQGALRSPVLGTLLGALLGLAALGPLISQAAPSAAPEGPMEASRPWTSGPAVKARFLDRLHTLEPPAPTMGKAQGVAKTMSACASRVMHIS